MPLDELLEPLRSLGVAATILGGVPGRLKVGDLTLRVELRELAVVTPALARGLGDSPREAMGVVVADRISEAARLELAANGWGWFDRRGHLRLSAPSLQVMSTFDRPRRANVAIRHASTFPPVGIEVAVALLKEPGRDWKVTDLAATLGRSAGGVSERLTALRDAGLVDRRNRPLCPDLFWELVVPWHVKPVGLASFPGLDGPFSQLSWLGIPGDWVLTDTRAAVMLGAPLLAGTAVAPDFYVPQPSVVDSALSHFAGARADVAATVREIRYAGIHESEPFDRTAAGFGIAHPVVVALDLAIDRARGREVVESWDPTALGVTRVW